VADHANLARLKAAYQTWSETKGEGERARNAWLDLLDDQVRIVSMDETAAGIAFARNRHSKEEAADYLNGIVAEWEMVHFTPGIFIHDGDQIAMFGQCAWTHRQTGKTAECHIAHLWQFSGDRIVSYTEVFDSARAAAAATPTDTMPASAAL